MERVHISDGLSGVGSMSGGSLNYAYHTIDNAAHDIRCRLHYIGDSSRRAKYKAFTAYLELVSKALHDVEWVLSSDYREEDADKAIDAVLSKEFVFKELISAAIEARNNINEFLRDAGQ